MKLNTAGNPIYDYDMCALCNLDTGGQHEYNCPLARTRVEFSEPYSDFVKWKQKEIDDHPEWSIEYL